MTRHVARKLPLEPLERAARRGRPAHVHNICRYCLIDGRSHVRQGTCYTDKELAGDLGQNLQQIYRWRRNGITTQQADQLAVRIGSHPALIWPDWTFVDLMNQIERERRGAA